MSFTLDLVGFDTIGERLKTASQDKFQEVSNEMRASMATMAQGAKRDAPNDLGRLQNSISFNEINPLKFEMVCQVFYAAYVEFGTKSRVSIPPGLEAEAAKFMGKGKGDYFDFLNAILDWVKRKGIGFETFTKTNEARKRFGQSTVSREDRLHDVAEAIAFSIIRHGLKPHPFFFKQLTAEQPLLIQRLKTILGT